MICFCLTRSRKQAVIINFAPSDGEPALESPATTPRMKHSPQQTNDDIDDNIDDNNNDQAEEQLDRDLDNVVEQQNQFIGSIYILLFLFFCVRFSKIQFFY